MKKPKSTFINRLQIAWKIILIGSLILIQNSFITAQVNFTGNTTIEFTTYDGTGLSPTPTSGQLDSDNWAIGGMSDGASDYGDTNTSGDFARGSTFGGETSGGLYSIDITSDIGFWIQPGGSDFTPGNVDLRIMNNTGDVITDLDIAYDILYLNDQGRANSLNFLYSLDNSTFTPIAGLDFTTPEASDALGVQSSNKSISLSSLNIPDGTLFYLRWLGDDVSGGGSRDEYGLDNISIALPCGGTDFTVTNTDTGIGFCSIQEAIDDATTLDGHTIVAGAYTYTENITVNKNLTIQGANAGTPGTSPRTTETILHNNNINITAAGPINIDGFQILRDNAAAGDVVLLGGNSEVTVENNIFERNGSAAGTSIRALVTASGAGQKTISDNLFTGDDSGGLFSGHLSWNSAMYINGAASTLNILNNTIENSRTAINFDDFQANITLTGNTIDNNGTHVSFGGTTPTDGSFTFGANDFINNPSSTMINLSNVAMTFRLDITACTLNGVAFNTLSLPALFEVEARMAHKEVSASKRGKVTYVASTQYVNNFTVPFTKIDMIQNSVKYAEPNDVINLQEGTYNQSVILDKSSLTLQGATSNKTLYILDGTGLPSTGGAGGKSGIKINNAITGITIQDLTVQNYNGVNGNQDAGIYGIGGNDNLNVDNVAILNNINGSGFYANGPVDGVTINNCMVSGHTTGARGIVIWNGFKQNITFTNNMVSNNNCCGIELQDGSASGVTISNNLVFSNGDNGIGVIGLTSGAGPNIISGNQLQDNGRFGIEIKNPNGTGAATGDGSIVVSGNDVELTIGYVVTDLRDHGGIMVFRRAPDFAAGNPDIPKGVIIQNNTVSGYKQPSTSDGFGIVVEGQDHTVENNTLERNDVGLQFQVGHIPYTGVGGPADAGDQSNLADEYFGRGNAAETCNVTDNGQSYGSGLFANGIDLRTVGFTNFALVNASNIQNSSGATFCSIQKAIDASSTPIGDVITVGAGSYFENLMVTKPVTINGPKVGTSGCDVSRGTGEAIIHPSMDQGTIINITADNVTLDGFTLEGVSGSDQALRAIASSSISTIKNNVIQNISNDSATSLDEPIGIAASGSMTTITDNCINDVASMSLANLLSGTGVQAIAIDISSNGSANVSGNGMDGNDIGLRNIASTSSTKTYTDNTISASGTPFTIGILLLEENGTGQFNFTGTSTIDNADFGIFVAGATSSNPLIIENIDLTSNTIGVFGTNNVGPTVSSTTNFTVDDVEIDMSGAHGIYLVNGAVGTNPINVNVLNSTITNTQVVDNNSSAIAQFDQDNDGEVTLNVEDCTITDNLNRGLVLYRNATVKNTIISNNGTAPNDAGQGLNVIIRPMGDNISFIENTFEGAAGANANFRIEDGVEATFYNNSFDQGGAANQFDFFAIGANPPMINASGNWWGTDDDDTILGSFDSNTGNAYIDYSPFLPTGTDTDAGAGTSTMAFQGDFSGTLHVDAESAQFAVGDPGNIQEGVDLILDNQTLIANGGTYDEQVLIDHPVVLNGVAATKPVLTCTGAASLPSGRLTQIEVTSADVTINNFEFDLDMTKLNSAILASGATNNLSITNNDINPKRPAAAAYAGSYGLRNAISINYADYRVNGSNPLVSVMNNLITFNDNGSPVDPSDDAAFRSGVSMDEGAGTFAGNDITSINHDILSRFNGAGDLLIDNNTFRGGGVQSSEYNAGAGLITIQQNTFDSPFAYTFTSSLRLQNNQQDKTTAVTGNTFDNHSWGISLENYSNVSVDNNTFTPFDVAGYRHITVNTKTISSNSNAIVQDEINGTFINNTFNAATTETGTGMSFYNHDSDNDNVGAFTIGTVGNENTFNANITTFISLDNMMGSTDGTFPEYSSGGGWTTTMDCWPTDINIEQNLFDVSGIADLPGNMSYADLVSLEDALFHNPDYLNSCEARLIFFFPVTNQNTGEMFVTIQDAIDDADTENGHTIIADAWNYAENIIINKELTLQGPNSAIEPCSGTRVTEAILANDGGTNVTIASDNVTIKGFTLTNPSGPYVLLNTTGNNLLFQNNIVNEVGTTATSGNTHALNISPSGGDLDGIDILNNQFTNIQGGVDDPAIANGSASAIFVGDSNNANNVTGLVINQNCIDVVGAATIAFASASKGGKGAYGIILNLGANAAGEVQDAQITNNEISNIEGLWAHAIGLEGNTPSADVLNNDIHDITDHKSPTDAVAVLIEDNTGVADIMINNNSFTTVNLGVWNKESVTVDVTCNFWDETTAAGVVSRSIGPVTASPFLNDGTDDNPGAIGFQPVAGACGGILPIKNLTKNTFYATIQEAIDAATAADVIEIQVADFTEPGQIVVDKSLTIQGLGKVATTLRSNYNTASSGHGNDLSAWILTEPGTNVTIQDMTLDATGIDTYTALRFQDSGEVINVVFNEIKHSASQYLGIAVQVQDGNVDVTNSMFTEIGRIGVHYRNGVIPAAVISGTYSGNMYTGKGNGDWLDYALDVSGGTTIIISNNEVSNNTGVAASDGSTSAGILVTSFFPTPANSVANDVTITGNSLHDNTTGIAVGFDAADISVVMANQNNIFDNDNGVTSTGPMVDVTLNWWGDASGPSGEGAGTGDSASEDVDFCPWLDAAAPGGMAISGIFNSTQSTYHCTIQEAIDAANPGDVIEAVADTYTENIIINKEVTLNGPNSAIEPCSGTRVDEAILADDGGTNVTIASDNVTIKGFTLTNPSGPYVLLNTTGNNLLFQNNIVNEVGTTATSGNTHALNISPSGGDLDGIDILNNQFTNIQGGVDDPAIANGSASAIFVGDSNNANNVTGLVINQNCIDVVGAATIAFASASKGGKGAYGIILNLGANAAGEVQDAQITNNEISNIEGLWAHAIGLEGNTPSADVLNNDIHDITDHKSPTDAVAVLIEDNTGVADIMINNNSFTTVNLGVWNKEGVTVDVTCNFWDETTAAGVASRSIGPVTASPFLNDGTDDNPGAIGFQPVAGACGGILPIKNLTKNTFYATIQEAIDAATAADVIEIQVADFTEPGQIIVDKSLTLQGQGKAVTTLRPNLDTGSSGDARGFILVNVGVDFDLKDMTVDGTGKLVWQAVRQRGSGSIDNVRFTEIKFNESGPHYSGVAVAAFGDGNVDITNSMFDEIGRIGVLYFGTGINGSNFTNNMYTGKGTGDFLDYALDISAGAKVNVGENTISDNKGVASVDGSTSGGILVTTFFAAGTEATITDNTITNNSVGIAVGFDASDASVVVANNNNITGNDTGVSSTAPTVDATLNWWGDASGPSGEGPGTGDSVTEDVIFCPWLDAAAPGGMPKSGIFNSTQSTYHCSIQDAIDAATPADIIEIVADTYNERLTIDKSLTLQGVTADKTLYIIDGTGLVGNGDGIFIQNGVTNVSIKNLTVQNFAGANGNTDAGIYAIGGNDDLLVDNVAILNNVGGSGFYANGPVDGVTINNCMISGHTTGARGIVIWNGLKENITFTNNMVSNNSCCGIELQDGDADMVTITGNTVTVTTGDSGMGLTGMSNAVVDNNIVNGAGRFGIEIKNPNGNVSVTNNQVTNTGAANNRDYAGIAVFRRVVLGANPDIPNGVTLTGNTVTGYVHAGPIAEGFGIVVEGTDHIINTNTLNGNDIGIQLQGGGHVNANYPGGDGDQAAGQSPSYFGRGNTPIVCDVDLGSNTFSGGGIEYRLSTNDASNPTTPRVVTDLTTINQYLDNEISFTINGVTAANTNNGSVDTDEDLDLEVCDGDDNVIYSMITPDLDNLAMTVDYTSSNLDSPPTSYSTRVTDFNDQIATLGILSLVLDNPVISGSLSITITTFNDANDNGVLDAFECTGDIISVTIDVKPNPDVVDPMNQIKCDGEMSDEVVFATTLGIPGTMYSWVNDTPAIGIAASGTSATIPATVLSNSSDFPVTATITVTPIADGCPGPAQSFTIRVLDSNPAEITCPDDITVDNDPGLCEAVVNFDLPMAYDPVFFDGFENGLATEWIPFNSELTVTPSGAIPSSSGANYGDINTTVDAQTGMFTRLGGYNSTFGDGFRTSLDVYMDLADPAVTANTFGWDLSSAVNNQSGNHRRDFIFHTASNVTGDILVGGSNNTNFVRREDIATLNHYVISSTGWYTFEFVYRDAGDGSLAVDLNLLDAGGNVLWTETRNTPADVIATEIGGNRYMWFTFIATDNLAIDNTVRSNTLLTTASPASGSAFPVGTTTVTITSDIDECGVAAMCTFDVIVNDTEQPTYEDCPSNFMICKSIDDMYNWTHVKLVDNCLLGAGLTEFSYSLSGATVAGPVTVTSYDGTTMASDMLNVGMTTVTYSAKDAAGNLVDGVCSFTITVHALPASEITADYAVWINTGGYLASVADAGIGASYTWTVSGDAMITSGDGTTEITYESGTDPSIEISVIIIDGNTCESTSMTTVKVIDPCDVVDFSEALELSIGTMPGIGLWSVDRFAPNVFESMATAPDGTMNTLHVGIDAADGQASGFHNTQGRKYQFHPTTVETEIELYVEASWAATGRRMAGHWGTALDVADAISAYPIIEFTSDGATPRFRGWESDGTWFDMGLPAGFVYDNWVTLRIQLLPTGEFRYTVETDQGNLMYNTTTHGVYGSTHLDNTIIQAHNTTAGVTYDVYWDNLNGLPIGFSLIANSTEFYHLDTLVYCDEDMVELVISGDAGDTYEIELNGSSVASGSVNDAGYSFTASPTTEGTYTIIVTNSDGCVLTEIYELKVNLLPESIPVSQEEACTGIEYTLTLDDYLTTFAGSATFEWEITDITPLPTVLGVSIGDTGTGDITHTVINPYTIVETIEYTITPTSLDGCEGLPFVVNVDINANPQVAINANGSSELCQGEVRNPLGFVLPSGSYSYDWKIVSASPGNASITNTSTLNPELTAQTDNENDLTIRFIATNNTSGCKDSTEVTFTVGAVPSFTAGEPLDLVLCEGTEGGGLAIFDLNDAITVVSPIAATVTYHTSASDAMNGLGALSSPESYTATDGEMIFVRLENNGCFITDDFTLTVNPLPVVVIDPVAALCALGDPVALDASPSGGTFSGTGVVGSNFDPELAGVGSHTVTYTVTVDGCTNSGDIVIVVKASDDIVMNNNNDGVGSLRYVVASTCAGDTVFFDSGLIGSTITLTSGEIDISSFKVIKGLGAGVLTVSGNDASRIFNVQSGIDFHVIDIKMINGSEVTDGGAILNDGSLILEDVTLEGNKENGTPKALTNKAGSSLTIRGNVIVNE